MCINTCLALLAVYGSYHHGRMRHQKNPESTHILEVVLFVWVLGFSFGEIQQVWGISYKKILKNDGTFISARKPVTMTHYSAGCQGVGLLCEYCANSFFIYKKLRTGLSPLVSYIFPKLRA